MLSASIADHDPKSIKKTGPQYWITNMIFVILVHVVALVSILCYKPREFTVYLCCILWKLSLIGVTMGYHRLWAHRAFKAALPLRVALCFLGTLAFQGSIKWWVFRHRMHHRFVDTENDPHNANRGLWFSHIGWIFTKVKYPKAALINMDDLVQDKVVAFQHKWFLLLSIFLCYFMPTFICGIFWNDYIGGLLYGGFVLRVAIWHCVFSINSFAHYVGSREFSKNISARGNLILAFFTCGEGHHNFHHEFPSDYRNGIGLFDYDPTKWCIVIMKWVGLASELKTMPDCTILRAKKRQSQPEKYLPYPKMTENEFRSRCLNGEKLILIDSWVVSIAEYIKMHPGGGAILNSYIGKDASKAFNGGYNIHSQFAHMIMKDYVIARIR